MDRIIYEEKEYIRRRDKWTFNNEIVNDVLQRKLTKLFDESITPNSLQHISSTDLFSQKKIHSKRNRQQAQGNNLIRQNYAFKCNFCDGGATDSQIGFNGKCSDSMIRYNIEEVKRTWCSHPDCPCRKYYDGKIDRNALDITFRRHAAVSEKDICTESSLLKIWTVFPGGNNRPGPMQGTMRRLPGVTPGKLCILTTREPGSKSEKDRLIFAAYIIRECDEGDGDQVAGFAKAAPDLRVTFNLQEARQLRFWSYYQNPRAKDEITWGSGLFRKFDDELALQFLEAMKSAKSTEAGKRQVDSMMQAFQKINR